MKEKLKIHLLTLARWFALPFFGGAALIGAVLYGGTLADLDIWLAFTTVALMMAGGHSFNTYLDTVVTGLDRPGESHSVEKSYTSGSIVITEGMASGKEVLVNAISWYIAALIPGIILAVRVTPVIIIPLFLGMSVTFLYSVSKFSYFHEFVLGLGVIVSAIIGALSTGAGECINAFLVSIPIVLIFSYAGLGLDEYPDAPQNLQKGVKSLAYKVSEYGFDLALYIMLWVITAFIIQAFFVIVGILEPLTALTLIILPPAIGVSVFLKKEETFKKGALIIVFLAMLYPVLLLVGQLFGS